MSEDKGLDKAREWLKNGLSDDNEPELKEYDNMPKFLLSTLDELEKLREENKRLQESFNAINNTIVRQDSIIQSIKLTNNQKLAEKEQLQAENERLRKLPDKLREWVEKAINRHPAYHYLDAGFRNAYKSTLAKLTELEKK